jgi:hypothetical protein
MSWEIADNEVYRSICHENFCNLKQLNQFKKDKRVLVGPGWSQTTQDMWGAFEFGAKLTRSKEHWFVFHTRSRFYAVKGNKESEVRSFIESFTIKGRYRLEEVR